MDRRVLHALLCSLILVARIPVFALAQPQGGQSVEAWAKDVAGQLYRASIGIALIGFAASLLALALAFVVPSMTVRNYILHFGGSALMGSTVSLILVMCMKMVVLTVVGFIDPNAANQLAQAFAEMGV